MGNISYVELFHYYFLPFFQVYNFIKFLFHNIGIELDWIGIEKTMNDSKILFLHEDIEEEIDGALGAEDLNLMNWDIGDTDLTEKIGSKVKCEEIAGKELFWTSCGH